MMTWIAGGGLHSTWHKLSKANQMQSGGSEYSSQSEESAMGTDSAGPEQ